MFDVVIPTYGRPEKLKRCLEAMYAGDLADIQLYVYIDNNDFDGYKVIRDYLMKRITENGLKVVVLSKQHRAFGVWNKHLELLMSDGMFYICDDVEVRKDCLVKATKLMLEKFSDTDGVIGLNQENIKEGPGKSVNAMALIGRKFAERFPGKQCFCPDYVSFHADAEVGSYARSINKFGFNPEAKLLHYHPSHFKAEMDATHNVVRGGGIKERDRATWNQRQEKKYLWGRDFNRVL